MNITGWSWAIFFVRWALGLIFAMAGWWKVFTLGARQHAQQMFVDGFAETWIPSPLLWFLGVVIPFVELAAGVLLCLGWRTREIGVALGVVLVLVTYGHLLQQPLYDTTSHIFPRLVLLTFVFAAPRQQDVLSVDGWHRRRRPGVHEGATPR